MSEGMEEKPVTVDPVVVKKKGISGIWLLPLVAAAVGGWLMYKSLTEAGIDVFITFESAEGIEKGKTRIMYKGLTGGVVKEIRINDDMQTVTVRAEMIPDARNGLRENSQFWLVKPKVSFTGVSGLDTLVSGNYIALRPGEGDFQNNFKALPKAPPLSVEAPGLHLKLMADKLGSIDRGSLVYYREIPVGDVQDYELADDQKGVLIKIHIEEQYAHLVKTQSRFWNASGLSINASLSGVSVDMESLSSLIAGGIAFFTPTDAEQYAENGHSFKLHENYSSAESGIPVTIDFDNGSGLEVGRTQVRYNNLPIGMVKKINYDENYRSVSVDVLFDPGAGKLLKEGTKFWIVRPQISFAGVSDLNRLVSGPYIAIQPGEGKNARHFAGLNDAPEEQDIPGLQLKLISDSLAGVEISSPVFYKTIRIGDVRSYRLINQATQVEISVVIDQKYAGLVNKESRFWNASGVQLKVGAQGVDLKVGSASSVLTGGIALLNPPKRDVKNTAAKGAEFKLYSDYASASENGQFLYTADSPGIHLKLLVEQLGSLEIGSPVMYRQVAVGEIKGYRLDHEADLIIVDIHIKPPYHHLINSHTRFWNSSGVDVNAGLSGVSLEMESVASLMRGGVAFYNPPNKVGEQAKNGQEFPLYKDKKQAKQDAVRITLSFETADSLAVGTPIKYRGLVVGKVKQLTLSDSLEEISAAVDLYEFGHKIAREKSQFWLVGPTVSLTKTENLETLVTGAYIGVLPGAGDFHDQFDASLPGPIVTDYKHGLNLTLLSDRLGSLKRGSHIYYRQIPIGEVINYALSSNAADVLVYVNIEERYKHLVRKNSKFWNVSGVAMNLGVFSGLSVKTESVEALMGGGIAMATPEGDAMGVIATQKQSFKLYDNPEEEWGNWQPRISAN